MSPEQLDELCRELIVQHGCHSLILYGSRAQGTQTATSDIDIVGFRSDPQPGSDSRLWQGYWLDAWIYSDQDIQPENFLQLDGGKILRQEGNFASQLLAELRALLEQPPEPKPEHEIRLYRNWFRKTLARIKQGDSESWYRRHMLMMDLLENYFVIRQQRFLGYKKSMRWLAEHQPAAHELFVRLYSPEADLELIERCVQLVVDTEPG